jgi:hypothetical protein
MAKVHVFSIFLGTHIVNFGDTGDTFTLLKLYPSQSWVVFGYANNGFWGHILDFGDTFGDTFIMRSLQ